ncbi:Serine/threonine-protein kinase ATG1a [Colletotrichum aenigma]|uniref:Serine/threonine-protein kinase ATG1a n=1 Tax=Colletotrichum aenigma TaxID=1215731 RepID=UPI0018727400|nr:Serine/threonine-protein kinase ATG1a [Colletotrichum aenigma]KAF5520197.1 Serine/threonine-protein kinase ATG1a [Colletotrichum aenigma]
MKFSQDRYTPSFVKSYGWFQSVDAIYIAMEYVEYGDLEKHLEKPIPEDEARLITRQLAEGLHHLHQNGFTHRDLKPRNILVVSKGPDWLVQISDFGISRRLPPEATLGTMRKGTIGFIAPEVLEFVHDRSHPYAADVWSLGTIIFKMLTLKLFTTDFRLLNKYVEGEIELPTQDLTDHGATPSLIDLIRQLLAVAPGERPTTRDILDHRWVQMLSNITVSEQHHDKPDDPQSTRPTTNNNEHLGFEGDTDNDPSAEWSTGFFNEKISRQSHLNIGTAVGSSGPSAPRSAGVPRASQSQASMPDTAETSIPSVRETAEVDTHLVPEAPLPTARFFVDQEGTSHPSLKPCSSSESSASYHPGSEGDADSETSWFRTQYYQPAPSLPDPSSTSSREFDSEDQSGKSDDYVRSWLEEQLPGYDRVRTRLRRATSSTPSEGYGSTVADAGTEQESIGEKASAAHGRQCDDLFPEVNNFRMPWERDHKQPKKVWFTKSMAPNGGEPKVRRRLETRRSSPEWHRGDGPEPVPELGAAEGQHKRTTITTANQHRVVRKIAQRSDANKLRISYEFNIDNWDPAKRPILFLNFVFDLVSIGIWLVGRIDHYLDQGSPIGDNADATRNLARLLENLDYKVNDANYYFTRLREHDKELVANFVDSGERLFDDFKKLLQRGPEQGVLEEKLEDKSGEKGSLGSRKLFDYGRVRASAAIMGCAV